MAHEQQVIVNKFPFAATPYWVRYVDPATGAVSKIAGVPVSQNGSWLEDWEGSTTVDEIAPYQTVGSRQFFVVAHDGDNSGGRAGALGTWQARCSGGGPRYRQVRDAGVDRGDRQCRRGRLQGNPRWRAGRQHGQHQLRRCAPFRLHRIRLVGTGI